MSQAILPSQKSTNVRSYSELQVPAALRWARRELAALAGFSPGLGERFALKLFMTPKQFSFTDAEFALLATARPFRVGRLAAWQWGEGPVVLLIHGWEGRGAQLGSFVEPLVARGFSVVTFDAPAHGVSPGERAAIPDFAEAARAVARKVGPIHAVVAHSLGALAALLALRQGLAASALVLVGTPSPTAAFDAFRRQLEIPEALVAGVRSRIEHAVGITFDDIEGHALARGIRVPALLVHDDADREAAFTNSQAIAGVLTAAGGASVLRTQGLGHRRILQDEVVVSRVVEFVSSNSPQQSVQRQVLTG